MFGVFLDKDSVDLGDLDFSVLEESLPGLRYYRATTPDQVSKRIAEAAVVISNKVRLGADALAAAPKLKLICVAATGVNNVDLKAAAGHGVKVCNARGYATPAVVQHVFGMILALATRLLDYRQAVVEGHWGNAKQFCMLDFPIWELAGKTLGVVG